MSERDGNAGAVGALAVNSGWRPNAVASNRQNVRLSLAMAPTGFGTWRPSTSLAQPRSWTGITLPPMSGKPPMRSMARALTSPNTGPDNTLTSSGMVRSPPSLRTWKQRRHVLLPSRTRSPTSATINTVCTPLMLAFHPIGAHDFRTGGALPPEVRLQPDPAMRWQGASICTVFDCISRSEPQKFRSKEVFWPQKRSRVDLNSSLLNGFSWTTTAAAVAL